MTRFLAALLCLSSLAVPASAAERRYTITGFDRIRVDGPYSVKLKTGVAPFARAKGSAEALDAVAITVSGRTLIVQQSQSSWGGYPGKAAGPVEIEVGTHELVNAWLNGSGSLDIDKVKGLAFDLSVQGAGVARVGSVAIDQLKVGIAGTGTAALTGKAGKATAVVRGVSTFDSPALTVKDAVVGAEGQATVRLAVVNSVKVNAAGPSQIELTGNPACTVTAAGSATIKGCD